MPVTSAASWYCSEYIEKDTRRKSECQYSRVIQFSDRGCLTGSKKR
jgi:hypothetical protein